MTSRHLTRQKMRLLLASQQRELSYQCCAINQYIVLVLQKKCNIGFEKHQNEYQNIGISILTTISANIGLKWCSWVEVMGYFIDFVPLKYQSQSKLSHKYLTSTNLREIEIDISKISVSNQKYRIGFQKPISPSTSLDCI